MKQRQEGFTLIEIVLATAIAGAIVAAVAMAVTTLLLNSQQPGVKQILLQQVQNAGYWIPRDIQMSNDVTLGITNGFPFTVNIPVDLEVNNDYTIDYLFDGNTLKRQQFDSLHILTDETLIAQYVDTDNTTFVLNITESSYNLTIRVSIDEESVTASYEAQGRIADTAE